MGRISLKKNQGKEIPKGIKKILQKPLDICGIPRYNSGITSEKEQVTRANLHTESRRWCECGCRPPGEWAFEGDPKGGKGMLSFAG